MPQQHDIRAKLARGHQHSAQPRRAVAVMLRGDAVVIDMQIRAVDEDDLAASN